MTAAIAQARNAKKLGDFPFGAVVVCGNEIVGKGKCENNTVGDVTDHAEILAVRDACKNLGRNDLHDCRIYCTNEPCLMCASTIFQAKISHLIIGLSRDDLPHLLRARNLRIGHLAEDVGFKVHIKTGVLKERILLLFQNIKK
jgi:tRNA(adenine34) deaminase